MSKPRATLFETTEIVETLPPGEWTLRLLEGEPPVLAVTCPDHPPRFYRNGRRLWLDLWLTPREFIKSEVDP
jgi:hypothetical protein